MRITSAVSSVDFVRAPCASRQNAKRRGSRACTARRTFSSTVERGKRLVIWNERPMPARVIRSARQPGDRAAGERRSCRGPGENMPEIRLNAVVLPAPLGPISACSVRSRIASDRSRTAWMPPNCLRERRRLEDRPHGPPRARLEEVGQRRSAPAWRCVHRGVARRLRPPAARERAAQRPTSPVGENTMKATNSRPKNSSQFSVTRDR